jgi:hypothetical protein
VLAIAPLVKNSGAVTGVVAAQLRAAQATGDTPARLDPDLEAFSLMATSAGLATSVLAGQASAGQAQAVIDYHLNRLFPASRPALRRSTTRRPPGSALTQKRRRHVGGRKRRACRPLPHPVSQDETPARTDRSRVTNAEQDDLRALLPHGSPIILRAESAIGSCEGPVSRCAVWPGPALPPRAWVRERRGGQNRRLVEQRRCRSAGKVKMNLRPAGKRLIAHPADGACAYQPHVEAQAYLPETPGPGGYRRPAGLPRRPAI